MGNRGRFGKYGEKKRYQRLRESKRVTLATKHFINKPSGAISSVRHKKIAAPKISFRKATLSDRTFIAQLSKKVFSVFGPYEELVPEWLEHHATETVIACVNSKPAGFAMIGDPYNRYDLKKTTELLAIAVEPHSHRMGIGELLLKEMEKKATELQINRIFLHTASENLPARSLFTKIGYRPWEIKWSFYPEGQDAIVMAKEPSR